MEKERGEEKPKERPPAGVGRAKRLQVGCEAGSTNEPGEFQTWRLLRARVRLA